MMLLEVGRKTYDSVKNINFAPEADVTSGTVSIDSLKIDVQTRDRVTVGQWCRLVDELGNLWARYWITKVEENDTGGDFLTITAMSPLYFLNGGGKLGAELWVEKPVTEAVAEILGSISYALDESLQEQTLSGFCPEQKPLERLQWICFAIGAYVRSCFTDVVEILPIGGDVKLVPIEKTFWRPKVSTVDYVTAVIVTAWSFASGEPESGDDTVTDKNGVKYIVTKQKYMLENPDAPSGILPNIKEIDKVQLVNDGNAEEILERLAEIYFARTEISADVLNSGQYKPGRKIMIYADEHTVVEGWVDKTSFQFGAVAKSTVKLIGATEKRAAALNIYYRWAGNGGKIVAMRTHILPARNEYRIATEWIDVWIENHRYVFYPMVDEVSGILPRSGASVTVDVDIALDYFDQTLYIYCVDSAEAEGKKVVFG